MAHVNPFELLVGTEAFTTDLTQAVQSATQSLWVQTLSFETDTGGY